MRTLKPTLKWRVHHEGGAFTVLLALGDGGPSTALTMGVIAPT